MLDKRSSGLLLHPTSLPGPHGIGDLGQAAYAWVDALQAAGQRWWQVLPLSPTGYADSPYQGLSAFAGNPNLISPDLLLADGLLEPGDLQHPPFADEYVDFDSGQVIAFKRQALEQAWRRFQGGANRALLTAHQAFLSAEKHWLDDYALFMALKDAHGGASWQEWEPELRERRPDHMERMVASLADAIGQHQFQQFLFHRQWQSLKGYANKAGINLIGDLPIFVSIDSADVWAYPQFFQLDEQRRPTVVAGVPPDYFSATGQLWGNPLYNWPVLRQNGYGWWVQRVAQTLRMVDTIRIDHFRGFEASYAVPAAELTALNGRWLPGPSYDLFDTLLERLGALPIIAEDLGLITPEVDALRTHYGFPGMRILQFAFAGALEERFLPHNLERNMVVYTGTHDNDTTLGWYNAATPAEQANLGAYLGHPVSEPSWDLLRLAWASVGALAIAPLQDVLALDSTARMNLPGQAAGYWRWRCTAGQLTPQLIARLGQLTRLYGRA